MRKTAFLLAIAFAAQASAQWYEFGNNGLNWQSDFVGTTDQDRLTLRTYEQHRLVINEDDIYTIGSFPNVRAYGFTAISPNYDFWDGGPGPFSRLHLAEPGEHGGYSNGYRPWMRNGITFTGNADQAYIGHKYTTSDLEDPDAGDELDYSDLVIQWSDNPGTWLSDRMRFIFTSEYGSDPTGNGSLEGLEAMQLFPRENGTEVFVGIGDWYGQGEEPEERLDVLDGRVRIRQLPNDPDADHEKVMVVDEDGVVHWRDAAGIGIDCDWDLLSSASVVATAYSTAASSICPDDQTKVGIGTFLPAAKLDVITDDFATTVHVANTESAATVKGIDLSSTGGTTANYGIDVTATQVSGGDNTGVRVTATGASGDDNYGFQAVLSGTSYRTRGCVVRTDGATYTAYAGDFWAEDDADYNNGVQGLSTDGDIQSTGVVGLSDDADATTNYGVFGKSDGSAAKVYRGVYGEADAPHASATGVGVYGKENGTIGNPNTQDSEWAGYFEGDVQITGACWNNGTWQFSDADLKINEQDLMDASQLLAQLHPKTYQFDLANYGFMGLPDGSHMGLLAQEVGSVMPQLVNTETFPATYDQFGQVVTPAVLDVQGLNYMELIPLLIAGWQEQQARIEQLENDLAGCCADMGGGNEGQMLNGDQNSGSGLDLGSADGLLKIHPNPFSESTTITYTLRAQGQVRLIVSTMAGRQLEVLEDDYRDGGSYTYEWDTSSLAAGMYDVMLLVDGAPVVRKAVKVQR